MGLEAPNSLVTASIWVRHDVAVWSLSRAPRSLITRAPWLHRACPVASSRASRGFIARAPWSQPSRHHSYVTVSWTDNNPGRPADFL